MRTEGGRNILIMDHMFMVRMLASGFRGAKNIPFQDIEAAGAVGLVSAAQSWKEKGEFKDYASVCICNSIKNLIENSVETNREDNLPTATHSVLQTPKEKYAGSESVDEFYEWQNWGDHEYIFAISEYWEDLAASPAEMHEAFDNIKHASKAIKAASIGFTPRERDILNSRYFSDPPSTIEAIARDHEISYSRVVFLINRMLNKIREIMELQQAANPLTKQG